MMRSLRLRLLLGAGVAILAALAVAWFAMTLLFARHIERREIEELDRQALPLIAGLHLDGRGAPVADTLPPDPRFQRPSGGLYWQVLTAAGTLRSRSLWDQDLPAALPAGDHAWHSRVVAGPFEPRVLLLERHLTLAGDRDVAIQFAEDEAPASAARFEFGQELLLFLLGLWLALIAAAALQVHLGLRPLARLREALKRLRLDPAERLAVADHPLEVEPLLLAINQLAEAREQDVARARRRAADLAHGLKTPLAALKAQSRKLRNLGGGTALAEDLDKAIAAAVAAVEAELARARAAAARERAPASAAPLRAVAEQVVSVVERTEQGAKLVFEVECPPDLTLPASAEEASEILGALVENAARFARRRVRITAGHDTQLRLAVEDDGPGLEDWQREEALARGRRLDESGPGHGLGLAIARDLVEARGGMLALLRSEMGGLKVEMTWPGR